MKLKGKLKKSLVILVSISLLLIGFAGFFPQPVSALTWTKVEDSAAGFSWNGAGWTTYSDANCSGGTIKRTGNGGEYADYTFAGTGVRWYDTRDTNRGITEVYIDSVKQTSIDEYGSTQYQTKMYEVTGLSNTSHTLRVKSGTTKNGSSSGYGCGIDFIEYTNGSSATPTPTPTPAPTPTPTPAGSWTKVEDSAAGFSWNGAGWTTYSDANCSGGTIKRTGNGGEYADYTFTGTGVRWYDTRDTNRGITEVYIDTVKQTSIDEYGSTQYQTKMYEVTGLSNTSHTLRVKSGTTKNGSSSGYGCGMDFIEYTNGSGGPTPTPTPTSTPTPTPTPTSTPTFTPTPTPTPTPAGSWTKVEDSAAGFSWNGAGWTTYSDASCSGGTIKRTASQAEYADYTFTGTGVRWYDTRDTNRGISEVYIDYVLQTGIDEYGSTQYQTKMYEVTGLSNASHTLRVKSGTAKNANSSGYGCGIDFIEYTNGSGGSTPTPTPTPAGPTPTPIPGGEQTIQTTQLPDQTDAITAAQMSRFEYGIRFTANVPGNVTKVRIYAGQNEGGSHTIRFWEYEPEGQATKIGTDYTWTFSSGTAGWKTYTLPTPVSITPYRHYLAVVTPSYDGTYYYHTYTLWGANSFDHSVSNGNLFSDRGDCLYSYTQGAMPVNLWEPENNFRDVVFVPTNGTAPYPTPTPVPYTRVTSLPQGNNGIAASYPGDAGITGNSNVIFADGFESYSQPSDFLQNWDGNGNISTSEYYRGTKSLVFTMPATTTELSLELRKTLPSEQDVVFLRYYAKFESNFNIQGSSHNGAWAEAHYTTPIGQSTPGIKANGINKFLVALECWRDDTTPPPQANPSWLNFYVYHPEMRDVWGDHFFPTGMVYPYAQIQDDFGPDFVSRSQVIPSLGVWHCYEYMVKANTAGLRDGRLAAWVDGNLVADFPNLRFRDINTLKMNLINLVFHCHSNPVVTHKWVDNVVIAKSYIGPVY